MTGCDESISSSAMDMDLLTFTVDGIVLGVDTAQIGEMLKPEQVADIKTRTLHEVLSFRTPPIVYCRPIVLVVKAEGPPYGIVVDRPDEILSVPLHSIRPLPVLMEKCGVSEAVWGFALKDHKIIVLVDFYKLPLEETIRV